jgi:hypothetical protein
MAMDDQHKNFSVWLFRERGWSEGDAGRKLAGGFSEPAEAADHIEEWMPKLGIVGQTYCELRFNGDKSPHTVICYLNENEFGIWNTEVAKWPIFYAPGGEGLMLDGFPFDEAEDGNAWKQEDESDKKQESDEGNMNLDEIESADEEDETDVEEDDSAEQEEDSGEDAEDDPGDDGSDDVEDFTEDEDEGEDSEDDGEDLESDEDDSDNESDSDLEEEEIEMPRLKIFAKMRGPLGWRKRAEAEDLQERNVFAMKIGVLDEEAEKPGQQEREVFAHIEFVEFDEDREAGILRIKIPEGVEFSERTKSGWITAAIPYRQEES